MNYLLTSINDNAKRVMGLFVLFICLATVSATAQQVINGKILDETGEALIGVSVIVQGTDIGTISDIDGSFSVAAAADDVLEVSYVGYKTQTIPVNGQSNVSVTLGVDAEVLDEVVVIGYGTVQKK